MYDKDFLKQLKRTNISGDGEKTKQRFRKLWEAATPEQKTAVRELSDAAPNTIYRIYNTGVVSPRMTVAIAQSLNVDPFYLTGEADRAGKCTDDKLNDLLKQHGYEKLLPDSAPPQRRTRRKAADTNPVSPETEAEAVARFETEMKTSLKAAAADYLAKHGYEIVTVSLSRLQPEAVATLSDDDLLTLFRSLRLRADVGVPGAGDRLGKIQDLLLF